MTRASAAFSAALLAIVTLVVLPARSSSLSQTSDTRDARHLRIEGRRFVTAEGRPFHWRGITAFRLAEFVASGRDAQARAYLKWARSRHLTVVRVFAMLQGFFDLSPGRGRAALPRLLQLAASEGLHVEVVGLTGTAAGTVDPEDQIRQLASIAARHPNALLELANEPYHPTQSADVHRADYMQTLATLVPAGVPVALGSIEHDERLAASGSYATWHVPRKTSEDGWGHVLAITEGAAFLDRFAKPVVSDEPIGAGPKRQPGRRDDQPERFRAAALLTRLVGLGATFHYEGGLQAVAPEGRELACFEAWNEAWGLLPDDIEWRGRFRSAGDARAAVRAFDRATAVGVFERQEGPRAWILVVRPSGSAALQWSDGWSPRETKQLPGIELIVAERRGP